MADAIIGIMILSIAMVVLLVTVSRENVAEQRLSDQRQAAYLAEATLCSLQSGLPSRQSSPEAHVTIEACPDGPGIPGRRWVRVTATIRREACDLIGLVPENAIPASTTREVTR